MSKPLTRQIVSGDRDAIVRAVRAFAARHSSFVESTESNLHAQVTVDAVLPYKLCVAWRALDPDITELSVEMKFDLRRIRLVVPPWQFWLMLPGAILCMGAALLAAKGAWMSASIIGLPGAALFLVGLIYLFIWSRKMERADESCNELVSLLWSEVESVAKTVTPTSAITVPSIEANPCISLFVLLVNTTMVALFFLFMGYVVAHNLDLNDQSGQLRMRLFTVIAIGVLLVAGMALSALVSSAARSGPYRRHFIIHFCNLVWFWCVIHGAATLWAYLIAFFDVFGASTRAQVTGDVFVLQAMVPVLELCGIAIWTLQLKEIANAHQLFGPQDESRRAAERWEEPEQLRNTGFATSCVLLIAVVNVLLLGSMIGFGIGAAACTWNLIDGGVPEWLPIQLAPVTVDGVERFPILTLIAMWSGCAVPAWTLIRKVIHPVFHRVRASKVIGSQSPSNEWIGSLNHIGAAQTKINHELDRFGIRVCAAELFSPTRVSNTRMIGSDYVVWLSIFDALLPPEELEAILWHEVGHCAYREAQLRWVRWFEYCAWGDAIRWIVSDSVREELFADQFAVTRMGNKEVLKHILHRSIVEEDVSIFTGPTTTWEAWRWFWSLNAVPYYHPAVETRLAGLES